MIFRGKCIELCLANVQRPFGEPIAHPFGWARRGGATSWIKRKKVKSEWREKWSEMIPPATQFSQWLRAVVSCNIVLWCDLGGPSVVPSVSVHPSHLSASQYVVSWRRPYDGGLPIRNYLLQYRQVTPPPPPTVMTSLVWWEIGIW